MCQFISSLAFVIKKKKNKQEMAETEVHEEAMPLSR